jgi:prepilin-type N-terminal cleavage/methylation domain-containing protein
MKEPQPGRGQSGFTLIETLVVLVLMVILMTFAVPSLFTTLRAGKLRGTATEVATLMRLARLEAIRRSCPAIVRVLAADASTPARIEGLVDCDGDGIHDADKSPLGTFPLPGRVYLLAPPDLEGEDSVAGLSPDPADAAAPNVAIFNGDGSVDEIGGFRFADEAGNFLEVWVEPAATARIEVHKCLLCTDAADRSDWYAQGDDGRAWEWK